MPMKLEAGIGIDIVKISRIQGILNEKRKRFLENTFSPVEQKYCMSHKDPAPHFAGTFAAKEATRKATGTLSLKFNELEVRRTKKGSPEIWLQGECAPSILISITHTEDIACAIALVK